MNTIFSALRAFNRTTHLLGAMLLLALTAPMCAIAGGTGPVITNATITPATLPVTGGVMTISATVTDSSSQAINSVTANIAHIGNVSLYNGGVGNVYTANVASGGNNTGIAPIIYTASITATDVQPVSTSVSATGQTTQAYDDTPPQIANAVISPVALPFTGGVITVSATVTDPNGRAINSVDANIAYIGDITLSNGGIGNVYTGNYASNGNNTGTVPIIYTATVSATNDLNLANSATAAGQTTQEDSSGTVPTASINVTHVMWTNIDGRLSLWNYSPITGKYSQFTYGPYPNWSAKAVADGPDGKTRILWDNTNGTASLWNLDNNTGLFSQFSFGPFPGWTANSLSVSP